MDTADPWVRPDWRWVRVHHLLALICVVAVVHKLTVLWLKTRAASRCMGPFPGPPHHWLVGHIAEFKQDGNDMAKIVQWGKKYPYAFPVKFGPFITFLTIHHPDYAKTMLSSSEPKDDMAYRFLKPWIGDGLLVSSGKKWFRNRRLLTPGFHFDVLKSYTPMMSDAARIMLDQWEGHASTGKPFELFQYVSLMTLDIIMKSAFSYSSNCQIESGTNPYIQAVYGLTTLTNVRVRIFPYHNDLIFYLSPHGFRFRQYNKVAHMHTEEVIRKRKESLKEENQELNRIRAKRNLDFLDILLCARDENEQGLSDEDIQAEVDTFMFEGHDTTASGLSFIFHCLACHPDHQQICRDEIAAALQDKDTIEWEDLNKIPYTTMCIKECLRLYPPVPAVARKISKPMTFFDGRSVPEGSQVSVSIFALHRNSTVWENPDVFDPLRFLPENVTKRSPHAFVPFSAGPRNCIGQTFAMNEMKVVVAMTLRRYYLIEDPSLKPKLFPKLVLRSLNGIYIKVKPVDP